MNNLSLKNIFSLLKTWSPRKKALSKWLAIQSHCFEALTSKLPINFYTEKRTKIFYLGVNNFRRGGGVFVGLCISKHDLNNQLFQLHWCHVVVVVVVV